MRTRPGLVLWRGVGSQGRRGSRCSEPHSGQQTSTDTQKKKASTVGDHRCVPIGSVQSEFNRDAPDLITPRNIPFGTFLHSLQQPRREASALGEVIPRRDCLHVGTAGWHFMFALLDVSLRVTFELEDVHTRGVTPCEHALIREWRNAPVQKKVRIQPRLWGGLWMDSTHLCIIQKVQCRCAAALKQVHCALRRAFCASCVLLETSNTGVLCGPNAPTHSGGKFGRANGS